MARVAVDVVVGRVGVNLLRAAGHTVVVEAQSAESDRDWFARALERGVEFVIAADNDLEILCYDHRVHFFRAKDGHRGRVTAERFIQWYAATQKPRTSDPDRSDEQPVLAQATPAATEEV